MSDATVYPTTGWVYNYLWSNIDNATWTAFSMYQLYYSFVLLNEALLNYKYTVIWALVFGAIAVNIIAAIAGFFMLDCMTFNMYYVNGINPSACDSRVHAYYFFASLCFISGFALLYFRKVKVVPEKLGQAGVIDGVVVAACISLNLAANIPCLYTDITTCFNQDLYQAIATGISFVYFDIWFLVSLARKSFEGGTTNWDVFQLSLLTGSMTAIYLVGSICYKSWGGNFYTNILWNMGYCLLPLYCVDSIVSPKFLKIFNARSTRGNNSSTNEDSRMRPSTGQQVNTIQTGTAAKGSVVGKD
ncbi:hypothetical protein BCR33DRAFT_721346, partial [Rhizoclosmatium globosum]